MTDSDSEDAPNDLGNDEGVWKFRRPDMQGLQVKMNFYCDNSIMATITNVLKHHGSNLYKKFRGGCFGHFYKLPKKINNCASAAYFVITREMEFNDAVVDGDEISFFVNDQRLRFRRFEYALITGLQFGASSFDLHGHIVVPHDSFYTTRFGNRTMAVDSLKKLFLEMNLGTNPENYLKVAKILFLYYFILGMDPRKTIVADWVWVLVENEDKWESFPWGSYSFQHLLSYITSIKQTPTSEGKREGVHFYGFSTAFLAWLYCAIPQLGITCARIQNVRSCPRILRYKYARTNKSVTEVTGNVYEVLVPTSEETKKDYWQSIEPEGTPLLLRYKKDNSVIVNEATIEARVSPIRRAWHDTERDTTRRARVSPISRARHDIERDTTRHADAEQDPHNVSFTLDQRQLWTDEICQNVHDRIRNDDDLIDRIGQSTYKCMRRDTSFFEEIAGHAARSFKNQMADILPGFMDYMMQRRMTSEGQFQTTNDPHFATLVEEQVNDVPFTTPVEEQTNDAREMEVHNYDDLEGDDPIWSQAVQVAEATARADINYVVPAWQRAQIENERTTYPPKLDFTVVRARAKSARLCSPFRPYDKRGVDYQSFLKSRLKRNVGLSFAVGKDFFKAMADTKTEMENIHIDAYLIVLYTAPDIAEICKFNKQVTITSTTFAPAMFQVWKKYNNDEEMSQCDPEVEQQLSNEDLYDLSQFVIGELPSWGHVKPWQDYDKVIAIVHIVDHWITCCIDLRASCITIYDSRQHCLDQIGFILSGQNIVPLARILPQVLRYAGFYDARPDITPILTQWRIEHAIERNIYKQTDVTNCGAFALKHAEAIFTGRMEEGFGTKDMKQYRSNLAKRVFAFSTDEEKSEESEK